MTFVDAIKTCMRKYATFSGRASRSEFWWFYLFTFIVSILAGVIDTFVLGLSFEDNGPLQSIASLGFLLPTLAATVRRLHDTGRSGWLILVPVGGLLLGVMMALVGGVVFMFLIIVAALVLQLVWLCQASEPGANRFGPNPFDDASGAELAKVFE